MVGLIVFALFASWILPISSVGQQLPGVEQQRMTSSNPIKPWQDDPSLHRHSLHSRSLHSLAQAIVPEAEFIEVESLDPQNTTLIETRDQIHAGLSIKAADNSTLPCVITATGAVITQGRVLLLAALMLLVWASIRTLLWLLWFQDTQTLAPREASTPVAAYLDDPIARAKWCSADSPQQNDIGEADSSKTAQRPKSLDVHPSTDAKDLGSTTV